MADNLAPGQANVVSPVTVQEFSKRVKEKYPDYKDVDDLTLAQKMIEKYPEYKDRVSFDQPEPITTGLEIQSQPINHGSQIASEPPVAGQPLTYMQKELRKRFPENYVDKNIQPEKTVEPKQPKELGTIDKLKVDYFNKTRGPEIAAQKEQEIIQDKPSFAGKLGKTVGNEFMGGLNQLYSWTTDVPGFIYDLAGSPFRAAGLNVPTSKEFQDGPIEKVSEYFKANSKTYEERAEKANPSKEKGIINAFNQGDIEGGILNLAGSIANSTPASIAMMLSGGATAPTILGSAAVFGAAKAQEIDENSPEMDYDKGRLVAALNGSLEGIFETYLGSGAVGKSLANIIKREGEDVAKDKVKRSLSNVFADMITKNPWLTPLGEGFEEVGTQLAQNMVDKYSGYKPDLNIIEGVGDSFLAGVGMGAIHGSIIGLANQSKITTAQIEGQNYTIRNPEDLGVEGKAIFAVDPEGNVKPFPSYKVTDFVTQTPEEIANAQQQADEQQSLMQGIEPTAQIKEDISEELPEIGNLRVVDFDNGQSKIFHPEGELIVNNEQERDAVLEKIFNGEPLPQPKVNEQGQVIEPAPERKVVTQKFGNTSIDIIENEGYDEIVPSEKMPLEKALPALEKKFKDNKKFKLEVEKVQIEEPGETKYDEPVKKTVVKSIKIVPITENVTKNVNIENQNSENISKTSDQEVVTQPIEDFNLEKSEPKLQENEKLIEKSLPKPIGERPISQEGENASQEKQRQGIEEGLEQDVIAGQNILVKEPWQMTNDEWESNLKNAIGTNPDDENFDEIKRLSYNIEDGKGTGENNFATHKDVIKQALSEGKPVPQEVLNDYPDLAIERAASEVNINPSEAQREAGNYKKAHVKIQGMDISIENPKGSVRSGTDEDGKAWETEMQSHYGYFKRTNGKDGDHIDTFIGDNPESETIFVIDQNNPKTGEFDESKVMTGFNTIEEAKESYLSNYEPGWKGFGSITEVPIEDFKKWLYDGARQRKPFSEYKDTPEPIQDKVSFTYLDGTDHTGTILSEENGKVKIKAEDGKVYKMPKDKVTRFRIIGEKGAGNLDKAEEATIPETDNLNVSSKASSDLSSRPNVVKALTKISEELGEPVRIINSLEIPEKVGELKKQIKKGNRVPAFFYNGQIYLISDQITSVSDALKSYLHELIIHKGLRDVFSKAEPTSIIGKQYSKFNDLMLDVFGSMKKSQKVSIASSYVPGLYNENGKIMRNPTNEEKALIGEEFLAHVSENQEIYDEPTLSKWRQFINRLWQIIRKAFRLTSNQFSQKDLLDIVRESREQLKNKANKTTETEARLRVTDENKSDVSLGKKPMTETKIAYPNTEDEFKYQVDGNGNFILHRGTKEGNIRFDIHGGIGSTYTINKDQAEGYGEINSYSINPNAKILNLVNQIDYTDRPDLETLRQILKIGKARWDKMSDNGDVPMYDLWGNEANDGEWMQKIKKAGYDIVMTEGLDGAEVYVLNSKAISEIKSQPENTILINGVPRPTLNSNGKPIANSEEGIRNFWKWFGDSKVVDENGRPLVVYHGSPVAEIDTFINKGRGIWFTNKENVAKEYTLQRGIWRSKSEGATVYPTYLSLKNPLIIDAMGTRNDNIPVPWQQWKPKVFGNLPKDAINSNKLYDYAVEHGYDGLILKDVVDTADVTDRTKSTVYTAISPSQIKSATGNNGEFSPESNDIRFRIKDTLEDLKKITSLPKKPVSDLLKSVNETVESNMQEARGIQKTPLWETIKKKLIEIKESTQHFKHITESEFPIVYDKLRQFEAIPDKVKKEAYDRIANIVRPIYKDDNHRTAFERYIVLQDLIHDIEDTELFANKELPWGYNTIDEIKTDMRNVRSYVMKNPVVLKAIRERQAMMKDIKSQLVEAKLLKDNGNDNYFHHQVLQYMEDRANVGVSSKDVRNNRKGWQRSRTGSIAAYNTNYVESEFEVLAQSLEQLSIKKLLGEIGQKINIMPELVKTAKEEGGKWRDYIPEGYTTWFPKKGTNAYKAASMAEKAVQNIINDPDSPDVSQYLAETEGSMWVIPEKVAKQLDEMKDPEKEMVFPATLRFMTGKWKQWILLNPFSAIKYNFNNFSGDIDIVMAYNPEILKPKYAKTATTEAWSELRGKGMSEDMKEALQYGIITSGISIQEIPDINQERLFKSVINDHDNIAETIWGLTGGKYWTAVTNLSQFRENVLRLASYKYFKEQIEAGKTPFGASNHKAIQAMYDENINSKEIAAKLSRELMGDYGNLSQAGQWFRSHSFPFWSWVEINSPRYFKLLKNTKVEDNTGSLGRIAGIGAAKTAVNIGKLGIKAMLLMGLVVLWNRTFFPDEDDELQKLGDHKLKLIVGRRDDGSIMTMKIQGAFSDMLSFFGLEDVVSDVEQVQEGKSTIGKKAAEGGSAFVNKFAQGAMPLTKTTAEVITKKSFYPDIMNPRPVRDRAEQGLRIFKMDKIYNYLTHKPVKPFGKEVTNLLVYENNPGEAAYYTMREKISEFLKDNEQDIPSGEATDRSNALYYYKKSLKIGDQEGAKYWFDKYRELGGTGKGYQASMKKGILVNTVPKDLRAKWIQSLDEEDKEILELANEWYMNTYLKVGIPLREATPSE